MNKQDCKHWLMGMLWVTLLSLVSCYDDWSSERILEEERVVNLTGYLQQRNESRANDAGFVNGDRMGIYMVDYVNNQPGVLSATDNRASNVLYTFNGTANKWESATTLYWKDKNTAADFYGFHRQGYRHTITVTLNKNPEQIKIDIGGKIEDWN